MGRGRSSINPKGVQFNSPGIQTIIIQPPGGTGDIAVKGLITADGDITFNGLLTSLGADVITSGQDITFNSPVKVVADQVNLNTGLGITGNILFKETVDGTTINTTSQDLTLEAGSGDITFDRDAGSDTESRQPPN
jgi:hypothetical protein